MFQRWDICRAYVEYEEKSGGKRRPVLVINVGINTFISFKITKNISRDDDLEYKIIKWQDAGLDCPSCVRLGHKVYFSTLDHLVKLGRLQKIDIDNIKILCQKYDIKLNEDLNMGKLDWDKVQWGVHQFSTDSIIFRGTEEECQKYIDARKELWDDAEVYFMTPDDPHYIKQNEQELEEAMANKEKLMKKFPELNLKEDADESLLEDQKIDFGDHNHSNTDYKKDSGFPLSYRDELKSKGYVNSSGFKSRFYKHLNDYFMITTAESPNNRSFVYIRVLPGKYYASVKDQNMLPEIPRQHSYMRTTSADELFNALQEIEKEYINKVPSNLQDINEYKYENGIMQLAKFCDKRKRDATPEIQSFLRRNKSAYKSFGGSLFLEKSISGSDAIFKLGVLPEASNNILKEVRIANQDRSEINYLLTNIYIFALKALDEIQKYIH